ncbi:MAG: glycosyltransferase family 4 protein [Phycisphaerae bacterium]|jgi:glycosyltransferase involved in cell wall biosynthesis
MSVRVIHVVDQGTCEDGARQLSLLLGRLRPATIHQRVVLIGSPPPGLSIPPFIEVIRVGQRWAWFLTTAWDARRAVEGLDADVFHAWGASAAAVAALIGTDAGRVTATLSDPSEARAASRWWWSIGRVRPGNRGRRTELFTVCTSATVQRRLVEAGIPMFSTVVIRPGVDFAAIRQAKARVTRQELGLPATGRICLTIPPPTRRGGHFLAVWAMAMLHVLWPEDRLVLIGRSRERDRLDRLKKCLYCPEMLIGWEGDVAPADALSACDLLLAPATGDVATGWLAWAMAASVPIVASAVPAIAELIADRHNGFLCRPGEVRALALRIRSAWESPEALRQCARTAHGQAYDVFRAEVSAAQYERLFQNLAAGCDPADGVRDAALDTG